MIRRLEHKSHGDGQWGLFSLEDRRSEMEAGRRDGARLTLEVLYNFQRMQVLHHQHH